jgi:hypothetical protein
MVSFELKEPIFIRSNEGYSKKKYNRRNLEKARGEGER